MDIITWHGVSTWDCMIFCRCERVVHLLKFSSVLGGMLQLKPQPLLLYWVLAKPGVFPTPWFSLLLWSWYTLLSVSIADWALLKQSPICSTILQLRTWPLNHYVFIEPQARPGTRTQGTVTISPNSSFFSKFRASNPKFVFLDLFNVYFLKIFQNFPKIIIFIISSNFSKIFHKFLFFRQFFNSCRIIGW